MYSAKGIKQTYQWTHSKHKKREKKKKRNKQPNKIKQGLLLSTEIEDMFKYVMRTFPHSFFTGKSAVQTVWLHRSTPAKCLETAV